MDFSFSKSYLTSYLSDDGILYKGLRLYYVYQDKNLLGHYFRQGNKQFFNYQNDKYKVESTKIGYKKEHYKIVDENSGEVIGEYFLPHPYNATFSHYPDVPYTDPYLKVFISGSEYELRRQLPETEYRLFDSKTWGHFRFGLYDKQNLCSVNYVFKIENPLLDGSIIFNNNLEGVIENSENNLLLMFAGLFLLERFFDDQDRSG